MSATGHCNCGKVTVEVKPGLPDAAVLCHCTSCRRTSGSVFSSNLVVKKADLAIKGEEHLKQYRDTNTDSGRAIVRHFCGNCGSSVRAVPEADDSTQYLKAGLFDPRTLPSKIQAELFVRNMEPWQKVHEGAHSVEGMA